ncbi:MotE family protein [Hoeflea sp. TYP-13]|uniref:MotE family protein n=1 Tax=Hoeflea sp. TYP-13 TaxID=3230023 RepID=UPI0034C63AAA
MSAIVRKTAASALALAIAAGLTSHPLSLAQAAGKDAEILQEEISDEIRAFCTNIADAARDQRYLLQKQELEQLQADIEDRIAMLEKRRAEYENWLQLRNDFLVKAEGGLVEIYKNMRADSAAEKLELVNINVAAAIVMKLKPRLASQILNEMDAEKAANLTSIIASAADTSIPKDPS